MDFQLWRDVRGYWSVCEGPVHLGVAGYIIEQPNGTWKIEGDRQGKVFLDQISAASSVLRQELPPDVEYYELRRGEEVAFVATYADVLDRILADGWTKISSSRIIKHSK
jgi:hypothetical protein